MLFSCAFAAAENGFTSPIAMHLMCVHARFAKRILAGILVVFGKLGN